MPAKLTNPVNQIVDQSEMFSQNCCDIGQTCIGKDVKMTYFLE